MSKFSAIPQPTGTLESLQRTVVALKEVIEVLARQRGDIGHSAVTWDELERLFSPETGEPLIDPSAIPVKHGS